MTQSFFVCYSGTDRYGNTHMPYKAVVQTADEAIEVINTWKTYGKPTARQIKVNAIAGFKIREYFTNRVNITWDGYKTNLPLSVRTTGCGCWDIIIRPALADTLEEHDRIYNEQREAAKQERKRQAEAAMQRRLGELYEQKRGWYHVSLEIRMYVFTNKGNDIMPYADYSCDVIADSGMNAYDKTVKYLHEHPEEIKHPRGSAALQSVCEPTSSGYDFTFLGVKTDDGYSIDIWNEWKEKGEI